MSRPVKRLVFAAILLCGAWLWYYGKMMPALYWRECPDGFCLECSPMVCRIPSGFQAAGLVIVAASAVLLLWGARPSARRVSPGGGGDD